MMEYRIFILFFMLVALSFVFALFSRVILKIREKYSVKISPLVWAVFFFVSTVPIVLSYHLIGLKLYTDFTGGLRVEIYGLREELLRGELYIPKKPLDLLYSLCGVFIVIRTVNLSARLYLTLSSYFNSLHFLTKHSAVCTDGRVTEIFERARKRVGVRREVKLRIMKDNLRISPCTCGMVFPSVFVGEDYIRDYSERRLELVFVHELIHVKRWDSLLKIVSSAAASLQLSRFCKKVKAALNEDTEYLCDRGVVRIMGEGVIGEYMGVIIDAAERNIGLYDYGSVSPLSASANFILNRYKSMKSPENGKRNSLMPVLICAAAALLSSVLFSFATVFNADNLGVDIANPLLEESLCVYFDLASPDLLTEEHLSRIYSIEFALYDTEDGRALYYIFNESRLVSEDSDLPRRGIPYEITGDKTADTRDIALFHDLRTVIFSDGLTCEDEKIYSSTSYAVISR